MATTCIKEKALDQAFAEAFQVSKSFQEWLVLGGRFARHALDAQLLGKELSFARGLSEHWWRHCWCRLPDGSESETDLLFVFQSKLKRFAVHIENKPAHGKLTFEQASYYRPRAAFMANDTRWLSYTDFETILMAPSSFINQNSESAGQFDRSISYESVGEFAPLFRSAVGE